MYAQAVMIEEVKQTGDENIGIQVLETALRGRSRKDFPTLPAKQAGACLQHRDRSRETNDMSITEKTSNRRHRNAAFFLPFL